MKVTPEEAKEIMSGDPTETHPPIEIVDLTKLSLEELRLECDRRGIKYHHLNKEKTLIDKLNGMEPG